MNFSLILNSRGRPQLLGNFLESVHYTTKDHSNIEVLISCDNDDIETYDFFKEHGEMWPWANFEFIERGPGLNSRLTNLAKRSTGKFIFNINDDTEILTNGWDEETYKILSQQPDIIYGRTTDNSADHAPNVGYSSFPIISRKAFEALGYFMSERFGGLGADVHLFRIFDTLGLVVDVPVHIRHVLHETIELVLNPDKTAAEMRAVSFAGNYNDCFTCPIEEDVEKVRKCINVVS